MPEKKSRLTEEKSVKKQKPGQNIRKKGNKKGGKDLWNFREF